MPVNYQQEIADFGVAYDTRFKTMFDQAAAEAQPWAQFVEQLDPGPQRLDIEGRPILTLEHDYLVSIAASHMTPWVKDRLVTTFGDGITMRVKASWFHQLSDEINLRDAQYGAIQQKLRPLLRHAESIARGYALWPGELVKQHLLDALAGNVDAFSGATFFNEAHLTWFRDATSGTFANAYGLAYSKANAKTIMLNMSNIGLPEPRAQTGAKKRMLIGDSARFVLVAGTSIYQQARADFVAGAQLANGATNTDIGLMTPIEWRWLNAYPKLWFVIAVEPGMPIFATWQPVQAVQQTRVDSLTNPTSKESFSEPVYQTGMFAAGGVLAVDHYRIAASSDGDDLDAVRS